VPAFAGLLFLGACTQDENESNAGRDTHMGAAGQMAPLPPLLPAAVNPPPPVTATAGTAAPPPVAAPAADGGGDAAMAAAMPDAGLPDSAPVKAKKK
jgi:hypothetical protein